MLLVKDLLKSFSTHKIKCGDLFLFLLKICKEVLLQKPLSFIANKTCPCTG